jgi:hypothetical protein
LSSSTAVHSQNQSTGNGTLFVDPSSLSVSFSSLPSSTVLLDANSQNQAGNMQSFPLSFQSPNDAASHSGAFPSFAIQQQEALNQLAYMMHQQQQSFPNNIPQWAGQQVGAHPNSTTTQAAGYPIPAAIDSASGTSASAASRYGSYTGHDGGGNSHAPTLTHRSSVPLYLDYDEQSLNKYQCLLRKQIELFETTDEDLAGSAQGRNTPIFIGQGEIIFGFG